MKSKDLGVFVKRTKMIVSSKNANEITKEAKFPMLFAKKVYTVIPSYASIVGVGCITNIVVS